MEQCICRTEWIPSRSEHTGSIVNVVICDHHRLFADALASVADTRPWTIVGTPADPARAVAIVAGTHVDICLTEVTFPDAATGVAGIAAIREVSPATKVVVLTASSDPELIMRAVQSGADAVVFKDDDIDTIIEVVEHVVNGPDDTGVGTRPLPDTSTRSVSGLELELLDRLLRGQRGKAVARALGISYSSTRTRIQDQLRKAQRAP